MKTIIITGASAGIGEASARLFASRGWKVIGGARREEKLKAISETLSPGSFLYKSLDVTDPSSVKEFFDFAQSSSNTADALLNNAGLARGTAHVIDTTDADIQEMVDVNISGLLRVTRSYLQLNKQLNNELNSKVGGHIINLSSIAGHQSYAGGATYCATKHGVQAIASALKHEVNGTQTRISNISPGLVETEFSKVRLRDENANNKVYAGMTPLTPENIAECVWFAASQPAHVNIDEILVTPTDQASCYLVNRKK